MCSVPCGVAQAQRIPNQADDLTPQNESYIHFIRRPSHPRITIINNLLVFRNSCCVLVSLS